MYQVINEGLASCFYEWMANARAGASDYWHYCRAVSAERAIKSGPNLAQLFEGYTLLQNDDTAEVIREEIFARMSETEYVDYEMDRILDMCDEEAFRLLGVPGWVV